MTPRDLLGAGTAFLEGFALPNADRLMTALAAVAEQSPFHRMETPGGFLMSVAMTNCGPLGWVSDRSGYRYVAADPQTSEPWPEMPAPFMELAQSAAAAAGFENFTPDACLINRYEPGTKLSLHQDKDEKDFTQPIVSVSLGLPATFLFGGQRRADKTVRIPMTHGDVIVWGGPARLRYHGVAPIKEGTHPATGPYRYNLTFRKAK